MTREEKDIIIEQLKNDKENKIDELLKNLGSFTSKEVCSRKEEISDIMDKIKKLSK